MAPYSQRVDHPLDLGHVATRGTSKGKRKVINEETNNSVD